MKKMIYLGLFLALFSCKKSANNPPAPPPPDITESLKLSIVNLNPDKKDSSTGHLADTFSWTVPHAYGDTGLTGPLPPNAATLMLESTDNAYHDGQTWLAVNSGSTSNPIGLTVGFPADTSYLTVGSPIGGVIGGSDLLFSDTVPIVGTVRPGLSRMLNWWRGAAIPLNDSVINGVNINTNPFWLNVYDTISITSKGYIGNDFVVSGTFSEKLTTGLSFTYQGSYCWKTWYIKATFSNLVYVFEPN